jgi:UDP-3-O-[3-hydroxymyristoyl] glucosamine N-acyltransferase
VHVLKQYSAGQSLEPEGIHPRACVDPAAHLEPNVGVGAAAVIEAGARIGTGTTVGAGAYVGRNVAVGDNCLIHPGVRLLHGVRLGSRVIVHAGTVVGSDGFGFVPTGNGHDKIPQIGDVVIEDDVEIGANCTIDRGTLGSTRIGRGVKIDNLVHIGHNVTIGENSVIVAQVGISGSTRVGRGVMLGGQAGVAGHVEVGDGARVGGQSGVTKSVDAGAVVSGYPAMDHDRARRLQAHLRRLPDLSEQVRKLEARLRDLEKGRE